MSVKEEREPLERVHNPRLARVAVGATLAVLMAGCGGGTPLGNPPDIRNQTTTSGRALSFPYFQRCINPIFLASLPILDSDPLVSNTCAGAGCHDDANGAGGAFRVRPGATVVDLSNPANTPDVIRGTDMFRNYFSAQGEVTFNAVPLSRLITKPRVVGVLHGGGLIFPNDLDPNVRLLLFWMSNPVPAGQSEFTSDPGAGACPTQ
jgi:hypothetical protein